MFIETETTPNPATLKFLPGEQVMAVGTREFASPEAAFDGLEAMRKFRPSEHDVILSDVAMPHMNGWELIAALRVRSPELPVILITGYSSGNWNEAYLKKQGIMAVLGKPIDMSKLASYLTVIAESKRLKKGR